MFASQSRLQRRTDSSARRGIGKKAEAGVVSTSSGVNEIFTGGAAMPVTVKTIPLWRKEIENQVGTLAQILEPVTKAGANLRVLMGYRYPGEGTKAAMELYPIAGKKVTAVASEAGMSASSIPTLLVEGDDKPGLGLAIAQAMSAAGINMAFFVAQTVGRRFSAVLGFESEADAKAATPLIKKATASKRK
jgi:hypothetical protein